MYDFNRCKLCAQRSATPKYRLKKTTIYECAACGFHFIDALDELPDSGIDTAEPCLDPGASAYIERMLVANGVQLRQKLQLVANYCPLAGARALDLGAGAGLFSSLEAAAGATVFGIEPQAVFREFARQKYGIALNRETIDTPYWQDRYCASFDLVTLWDVLEHVNFPVETLKDVYRVTKPGGWLFLDTPRRDAFAYRLSQFSYAISFGRNPFMLESLYSAQPFRHKQIFTRPQLEQLVRDIGYTVVQLNAPSFGQNKMVLVCRKI